MNSLDVLMRTISPWSFLLWMIALWKPEPDSRIGHHVTKYVFARITNNIDAALAVRTCHGHDHGSEWLGIQTGEGWGESATSSLQIEEKTNSSKQYLV